MLCLVVRCELLLDDRVLITPDLYNADACESVHRRCRSYDPHHCLQVIPKHIRT